MSVFGTPIAQSIAQLAGAAERATAKSERRETREEKIRRREGDQFESVLSSVEHPEALRTIKSNDQEEAREDHEEHAPPPARPAKKPRLDVSG